MGKYYAAVSSYLEVDAKRGRSLGEKARKIYDGFMRNKWIPYLKEHHIRLFSEIDTQFMARFQNSMLQQGIRSQTVNHYISFISQVFDHLLIEGRLPYNPCKSLSAMKIKESDQTERGCYEIKTLRGVFNKRWGNEQSYLLCLLAYTTNMRNIEIGRIQVKDIIRIDNYHFIDIPKSKTNNGVRIVPLHDFVYRKVFRFINKQKKGPDDFVFNANKKIQSRTWTEAYRELGKMLGYDKERLKAERITFYSGRHFWKTLMNSEGLGEAEEVFMGHKVSTDVARRYNHRDKQGKKAITRKAREVFAILDKRLFRSQ
jgi:integrase